MKRFAACALILLCLAFSCIANASLDSRPQEGTEAVLRRFRFSRGGEMPEHAWEITWEEENYLIRENEEEPRIFPLELAEALLETLENCNVLSWNGFHAYDPDVLDGESFSLEAEYADGTYIFASGENAFPERYREAVNAMMLLLRQEKMASIAGVYQYEGPADRKTVITLNGDGTWTFLASLTDKKVRNGTWIVYDNAVYLTEDDGEGMPFFFGIEDGVLLYFTIRSDSADSLAPALENGARFSPI